MPSRRLAEKAVERFGLLQVHGFPAPTHVQLPLELAPPKGGERPATLDPAAGTPPSAAASAALLVRADGHSSIMA